VRQLKETHPEELEAQKDELCRQCTRLLSAPRRYEDRIVVLSGSLDIESLPGALPILEDFKLIHRAVDVKKVQAEVKKRSWRMCGRSLGVLMNSTRTPISRTSLSKARAIA